jgi:hypothetical protein
MKGLTLLVLVAVLGLTCYNSLQIRRINLELAGNKTVKHTGDPSNSLQDLDTALKLAEDYSRHARKLIQKGQTEAARLELDKSLQKLEMAARLSQGFADGAADRVESSWKTVQKQVEKALEELSSQTENGRPEGNETASGEHSNVVGHNGSKRAVHRMRAGEADID